MGIRHIVWDWNGTLFGGDGVGDGGGAVEAVEALTAWHDAGRSQSLLSACPHARLVEFARRAGIERFFSRVDGLRTAERPGKAPQLRGHLAAVDVDARHVLVIGDRVDDLHAARACGARVALHLPAEREPTGRSGARDLGVPVIRQLPEAVRWALGQPPDAPADRPG